MDYVPDSVHIKCSSLEILIAFFREDLLLTTLPPVSGGIPAKILGRTGQRCCYLMHWTFTGHSGKPNIDIYRMTSIYSVKS